MPCKKHRTSLSVSQVQNLDSTAVSQDSKVVMITNRSECQKQHCLEKAAQYAACRTWQRKDLTTAEQCQQKADCRHSARHRESCRVSCRPGAAEAALNQA